MLTIVNVVISGKTLLDLNALNKVLKASIKFGNRSRTQHIACGPAGIVQVR